jgi:SAM-dependent methyltransferase
VGCGNSKYGTDRLDIRPTSTTTIVHDLEMGIPFPDNTFDEVFSKNNLEHLRNVGFHFDEIRRVLKPNGKLVLVTDSASCVRYYVLGTHTGRYEKIHKGDKHYAVFTPHHLVNHLEASKFKEIRWSYVETDTSGRVLDRIFRHLSFTKPFSYPRIEIRARK